MQRSIIELGPYVMLKFADHATALAVQVRPHGTSCHGSNREGYRAGNCLLGTWCAGCSKTVD